MRSIRRRMSVAWCAGIALALVQATAVHVSAQSLGATIRANDPLHPQVTLTNYGTAPCTVALTSKGTMTVHDVRQAKTTLEAVERGTIGKQSVSQLVGNNMKVLEPHQSVTIPLRIISYQQGYALESIGPNQKGEIERALYPLKNSKPLELTLTYAGRRLAKSEPRSCETITAATVNRQVLSWQVIAAVSIVLALTLLVLWVRSAQSKDQDTSAGQ